MTYLFAVGITVGILAGAWVYAGGTLGFVGCAGFLGWATYFAAGGGKKGIISTLCSNLSGVFWGVITIWAATTFTAVPSLFFTIAFAAIMCWQAKLNLLEFIPGTFIGNAAYWDCCLTFPQKSFLQKKVIILLNSIKPNRLWQFK